MEDDTETLTPGEMEGVANYVDGTAGIASPTPEEKYNVHLFLHRVATSDDTTKVGFLADDEVGKLKHPVRSLKDFALIATAIMDNDYVKNYFLNRSEIFTSTSLSRDGFLVKQATTQTKRIADISPKSKEKRSWFKKKEEEPKFQQ